MLFDEANHYLLSLGHETLALKLGLERIEAMLDRLDSPHTRFPSIQIAGTNGKGSTAAMLERICRAAKIKAGLYTSPHLISITERIRVDGREISRADFARMTKRVREVAHQLKDESGTLPTFFEQVTAIALCAFAEAEVEIAILETGLGGRLDATTAARAILAVITPVALDHQEHLGETLSEIAAEKAAIIREGVTAGVVIAPQSPEAFSIILNRAREAHVVPRVIDERNIRIEGECNDGRLRATFKTARDVYENICVSLRGRHQLTNALTAIETAEVLRERGFRISRAAIIEGIERAEHAGRLDVRRTKRGATLIFDGAHNAAGALALRAFLEEFAGRAPITLVFGAMGDKDLREIAATLFPVADRLILTQPDNARAASPEMLARLVPSDFDSGRITLAPSVREALAFAFDEAERGHTICVTGSLYLVGEGLKTVIGDG